MSEKKTKIDVILERKERIQIELDKPELIYGIEGLMYNTDATKAYIPIINKTVQIIKSDENRFFIPGHIEKDYKYAVDNKIKITQVVAPYFKGKNEESVRPNVETQKRHSVIAIIKHNKEDKYLCVDCKNRECKSFILGGIEKGETAEEAAIREVSEETGYNDILIEYKSPFKLINHFYAGYKGVNRYATLDVIIGKLNSDEHKEISEEENNKHVVKWIEKNKLGDFLNINNNLYALNILLNGETAIVDNGIMINSGKLNDLTSLDAREKVIEMLKSKKEEVDNE